MSKMDTLKLNEQEMATLLTVIDFFVEFYLDKAIKAPGIEPEKKKSYLKLYKELLDLKSTIVDQIFTALTVTHKLQ